MKLPLLLLATALAPIIWGTTYIVTTEFLPDGYPLTAAMLRALPAGLLLLAFTRALPSPLWLARCFVLGALNFSIFWWLLFVAAYALPGGIAATVGAVQPILVLFLSAVFLQSRLSLLAVLAGFGGVLGVSLLMVQSTVSLPPVGLLAAFGGAVSMAFGIVLTKVWQPDVSPLTFTAWQLTCGGALLLPISMIYEPALTGVDLKAVAGFMYLGVIGGALTYFLWFSGIARLGPNTVAPLGLLSPVTAVILGWGILGQSFNATQAIGAALVLASVFFCVRLARSA
ncbi:MAG: EamA family transporter [Pseudomonadota bacterium]